MPADVRKYARQTNARLIMGGILLLFLLGDGLIYIFYGPSAAVMGLICLAAGLFPLLLIWLDLTAIEWVTNKYNSD